MERCFAAGMRKDFLQTEEQKQKKRKCLEDNRNQTSETSSLSIETPSTSHIESNVTFPDGIDEVSEFTQMINLRRNYLI